MLYFVQPTRFSIIIGVILLLLGELGRLWAVGYAGSSTRTRTLGAARQLVTTGPYAYVRNPLYLGNGLLSVGICILSGVYWILPLLVAGYFIQYMPIVRSEEDYLLRTYGESYEAYRSHTPRWLPMRTPYPNASRHDFSWKRAFQSERRTLLAILAVCGLIVLLSVWKNA